MAVSATNQVTCVDDLNNLMTSHSSILKSFRECYSLCVQSGLFSPDAIQQVSRCSLGFVQLSQGTIAVVSRISYWLESIISFYRNVDHDNNPTETLKCLGREARDIAKCFKVIAQSGRQRSGDFHAMNDRISRDAERIRRQHQKAQDRADSKS